MPKKQMTVDLSNDLKIQIDAVTQKLAFLGISGSGKTYAAGKFVEELLWSDQQVIVVDTIGNWWGLRVDRSGKRKSDFSIPILGGERGDVPMESIHGKLVAETAASTRSSMILDVSDFTLGELRRFVTDFATTFEREKKRHKSPVHVIWEECQDIVPQFVRGEDAKMVGAVQRLIKRGRNYGVGTTLISQRSAAVNKDVLNQVETLFCFRTGGSQDRKAIEAWVVNHARDAIDLMDELPSLPTGVCFCWSPSWLKVLKRISIDRKVTFDASATPTDSESEVGKLTPIDLERFKKQMSEMIDRAKENDVDHLKRRIAELEKQVKAKPVPMKTAEKAVLKDADIKRIEKAADRLAVVAGSMVNALQSKLDEVETISSAIRLDVSALRDAVKPIRFNPVFHPSATVTTAKPGRVNVSYSHGKKPPTNGTHEIAGGARRMLQELVIRHNETTTSRTQLATLSGFSARSGTFATYLAQLNTAGFITKDPNGIYATEEGIRYLGGDLPARQTPDEILEAWCSKLDGKAKDMLRVLVERDSQNGFARSELADAVGLSAESGTFATYLAKLNSNSLIEKRNGLIFASGVFF